MQIDTKKVRGKSFKWIYIDEIVMTHQEMASNKVWMTQKGEQIPYKDLSDHHLDSIIKMLEEKKTNRHWHYPGVIMEKLRRTTSLGKVLYET